MAESFQITLVHGDATLAKWKTHMERHTLAELQARVPDDYVPGTYKIKVGEEDWFPA